MVFIRCTYVHTPTKITLLWTRVRYLEDQQCKLIDYISNDNKECLEGRLEEHACFVFAIFVVVS